MEVAESSHKDKRLLKKEKKTPGLRSPGSIMVPIRGSFLVFIISFLKTKT